MRARWLLLPVAVLPLWLVSEPRAGSDGARREPVSLTVFAAASLRDVFTALGERFERTHPGVTVRFNFAGSQDLRTQLEHGAPADAFASADNRQMELVRSAGLVGAPVPFATNAPVIVAPADERTPVRTLEDLATVKRLVIGAPEVPIGAYSLQIFARARARFGPDFAARVEARVVSRELNVRQVLTKVMLGEADAGIVYRTDARSAGTRVRVVEIPPELNVLAEYPVAVVTRSAHPELARHWVTFVSGPEGQAALSSAGFGSPRQ